ncbi:histidine phosphatase family protein, partial [Pseudomonas aeruginosa]|nr:histidine phosphatase family protein [Pseudomonas aeruginosa]
MQIILASPYDRTRETAEIINEHIKVKKPIEFNPLLAERRNPSQIIGKSTNDPEIKKIVDMMDNTYHSDDFRIADEENFTDLKERAKLCLKFLESRREKRIVVVTHGIFLKMLIAYITIGDKLNSQDYNKISYFHPSNNASVT